MLLPLTAAAQTQVSGMANVAGGVGNTLPVEGDVRLSITYPQQHLTLKPYVGGQALVRDNMGTHDETQFTYANGFGYSQELTEQYQGYGLRYGLAASQQLGQLQLTKLSLNVDGTLLDRQMFGQGLETLRKEDEQVISHLSTVYDSPTDKAQTLKGQLKFEQILPSASGQLVATYDVERRTMKREMDIYGLDDFAFVPFVSNIHINDATTTTHRLDLGYHQTLGKSDVASIGLRGEMRRIESHDMQLLNKKVSYDDAYKHDMDVAALWVNNVYRMTGKLEFLSRAELLYTRMPGKNLLDVVPTLRLSYTFSPRQRLTYLYGMRLVRPEVEMLNPATIRGAYTLSYGNPNLEGVHANQMQLAYAYSTEEFNITTTAAHIWADDGFNAIWMLKDGLRVYTWGNEGIRRAWSLTPDVSWQLAEGTKLTARATLMWDKRIAEAISMEKEHIGIDATARLEQRMGKVMLAVYGSYSEGNTIDLYSHQSRQYDCGLDLRYSCLPKDCLTLTLNAQLTDYGHAVVTQGAYVGMLSTRPEDDFRVKAGVSYRF